MWTTMTSATRTIWLYCEPFGVYNELDDDDCNDEDPLVNPAMNENCATSYDDDCDRDTNDRDPDNSTTYYADRDRRVWRPG